MANIPWPKRLKRTALALAVFYVSLTISLVTFETSMVYKPSNGTSDPAKAGLPQFSAKTLAVDGLPTILYWENTAPKSAPTLFYFHGNGGGLFMHTALPAFLDKAGMHVIAIEYPSYPAAEGKPSEATIIAQATALWDAKLPRNSRTPPAIWGYSLGTGVATQLAAKRAASALVLEAPFTAVVDRGAEIYPFIPVRLLMRNTYLSRDYIANIKAPLFIMHGDADTIIPIHHGRDLFALANEPKLFKEYKGFGHVNLAESRAYSDALSFIRMHVR